jgi:hypothetical protein
MFPRRCSVFVLSTFFCCAITAQGGDWGTIRGKVVWAEDKLPKKQRIKLRSPEECACRGEVLDEPYVVDPDTKGVRWVLVWLIPADEKGKLPIHPDCERFAPSVEVDAKDCRFEPRVLGIRKGQKVIFRNRDKVFHNFNILGESRSPTIPQFGKLEVDDWKVTNFVVPFQCGVHVWMRGYIRVFDHPYFAVTNAKGEFEIKDTPAGDFRLVVWHEKTGYLAIEKGRKPKEGVPVSIKKGRITEKKFDLKPEKE